MKQASSYPVTFGYRAQDGKYYFGNKYHLGQDRALPLNTPIDVGDTIIGLAGTTGRSSGVHIHIQRVARGAVQDPSGRGLSNTIAFPATVYATGYTSEIGNHVRVRDANNEQWSYFHLNEIKVRVGHVIRAYVPPKPAGDEMIKTPDAATKLYKMLRPNGTPSSAEITNTVNKRSYVQFINDAQNEIRQRDEAYRKKDEQIAALKADLANAQNQAQALAQRPTQDALNQLQDKLNVCSARVEETEKISQELEDKLREEDAKSQTPKLSLFAKLLLWFVERKKQN